MLSQGTTNQSFKEKSILKQNEVLYKIQTLTVIHLKCFQFDVWYSLVYLFCNAIYIQDCHLNIVFSKLSL